MANKADRKADAAYRADMYSRAVERKDFPLANAALDVVTSHDGVEAAIALVRDEIDRGNRGKRS